MNQEHKSELESHPAAIVTPEPLQPFFGSMAQIYPHHTSSVSPRPLFYLSLRTAVPLRRWPDRGV